MIERAHARLLQDVEGELRRGVVRAGLVHEGAFGKAALELLAEVVAEDPRDEAVLVLEVVVERLAVLARALDDVADGHLLEGHFVAEGHEGVGDEEHRAERVHGIGPRSR